MLLQEVTDSAQVSEEGSMEEDAEDEVSVDSEQVIQHWPFYYLHFVWQPEKVMTIAFSSKVVEKHKKVGNKKVLTGRLLRQRIKKQNKKFARSGK